MSELTKVDRALEIQVIDWLQWQNFPDGNGENLATLALQLLAKRKGEADSLRNIAESYRDKLAGLVMLCELFQDGKSGAITKEIPWSSVRELVEEARQALEGK